MWFFVIFLPFAYLFIKGRIAAAIINFFLCAVGLVLIPFFGIGLILIFIAIMQSAMDYKKRETDKVINKQAEANAKAMARHMKAQSQNP